MIGRIAPLQYTQKFTWLLISINQLYYFHATKLYLFRQILNMMLMTKFTMFARTACQIGWDCSYLDKIAPHPHIYPESKYYETGYMDLVILKLSEKLSHGGRKSVKYEIDNVEQYYRKDLPLQLGKN